MAFGLLMIGMGAGILGGGLALLAGAGLLVAVGIYAALGLVSILSIVMFCALRLDLDASTPPEIFAAE